METTIQRVGFTQRLLRVLRQKAERERKLAEERLQNSGPKNWRESARSTQCSAPKCGMQLEEIAFGDVRIDKCFACEGLY